MKVGNFMTRRVITATPETPILDAARLMLEHKISGMPVVNHGGRVVGIVSEHDLLRRGKNEVRAARPHWLRLMIERAGMADESARLSDRRVGEVMTPDPVTISEAASLEDACGLIEQHGIKRLPVVRDNQLVGVIARADLVRALTRAIHRADQATRHDAMTNARMLELERQAWLVRARLSK
jgi:CBS domain-containing protein